MRQKKAYREQDAEAEMAERRLYRFALALLCLVIAVFSCSNNKERVFRKSTILMDTVVAVSVVAGSEGQADAAIEKAFGEVRRLDGLLNFFSEGSELSRINRSAGLSAATVSPETFEVIEKALSVSEKTGGAFDATIGPEISLWDFPAQKKPDNATIRERLGLVNYRAVLIDKGRSSVFLKEKGMLLDLGGIAKGYAADRAVEVLKGSGIRSGLVSVAGDIKAFGRKPDGSAWRVGVRNPRFSGGGDEILASIELTDMAISTSGDYERYFVSEGRRYHHLLNPKTGYPAEGCRSVSVVTGEGAYADSFSTAVFVLGPDRGMEALRRMGFEGMIVDGDGIVSTTPGLRAAIEFQGKH